jgi:hypothetical protein
MTEPGETTASGAEWPAAWLGTRPEIYRPDLWRPASEIRVARFCQIYTWPLVLRLPDKVDGQNKAVNRAFEDTIAALSAPDSAWTEIPDLLDHLPRHDGDDCAQSYGEFVFFHDYVQSVLFRPPQEGAPLRLFKHRRVGHAEILLDDSRRFRVAVSRCNLYLFHNGVAILALELDSGRPAKVHAAAGEDGSSDLSLADVQDFVDKSRRCYAPYFKYGKAQAVPVKFTWLDLARAPIGEGASVPGALCDEFARIKNATAPEARTAPVFRHWRDLVEPVKIAGYEGPDWRGPVWRQIVDERIPAMSYVSLTGAAREHGLYDIPPRNEQQPRCAFEAMQDMRIVTRGDWLRLCFADGRGTDPLPYDPSFLHDFEKTACYDRHFPSEATTSAVRLMFAGYHVAVVGAGNYFDGTLFQHFRRHYFQMGLILQMEFASLLAVSSRISEAVRRLHKARSVKPRGDDVPAYSRFRQNMIDIEEDFLEVLHLFRFTGLSNQIQPRELYEMWRKTLDIDELFGDLKEELAAATQFILSTEQRRRAETANNLSTIAAIGVVLALAFSFLGMNVVMGSDTLKGILSIGEKTGPWARLLRELVPAGLALAVASFLGLLIPALLLKEEARTRRVTWIILSCAAGVGVLSIAIGGLFGWR